MRTTLPAVAAAIVIATSSGVVAPSTSQAAAPAPPLDACLDHGAFNIADRACANDHSPNGGNQFGPIRSVDLHELRAGEEVTLAFSPVGEFFTDRAVSCGSAGCIGHGVLWRTTGRSLIELMSPCGATDRSCTVRYWPGVGDSGEDWGVLYSEHYLGMTPMGGTAHALYAPPRFYPLRVDTVDAADAARPLRPGSVAFAVRTGSTATAAACARPDWIDPLWTQATFPVPDCVELRPGTQAGAPGYEGYLPVDSGTWTIVGDPRGEAGATLSGRPSAYRTASVTPLGDDLHTSIVELRRPALQLTVAPTTETMELGTTQELLVTVEAAGGEAGTLVDLAFDDPDILAVGDGPDGPLLEVVEIVEGTPTAPFALASGEARTFTVRVAAVGVGTGRLDAVLTGRDDLGDHVAESARGDLRVVVGGGAEGVPPPDLVRAIADPAAGGVDGTVIGAPGAIVGVTVFSSPATAAGACDPRLEGGDVARLGRIEVTLAEDGMGSFSVAGPLAESDFAYAIAAVGGTTSAVSDCRVVEGPLPRIAIADAQGTEGTGDAPTALTVELTLSYASEVRVSVTATGRDGSATAPVDYLPAETVVTFEPGTTTAILTLQIVGDNEVEADEDLAVLLSSPVDGRLEEVDGTELDTEATGTIVDDDAGAAPALDLRGTWELAPLKGTAPPITLTIDSQDAAGLLTGTLKLGPNRVAITGRLQGDTLTLKGRDKGYIGSVSGEVKKREGTLSVVLRVAGKDGWFDGDPPVRATLVRPRGSAS